MRKKIIDIQFKIDKKLEKYIFDLKCPICLDFLKNPMKDNCGLGHNFCNICIYKWILKQKICPLNQNSVSKKNFSPNFALKSFLKKIKVKCSYCKKNVFLENREKHFVLCNSRNLKLFSKLQKKNIKR